MKLLKNHPLLSLLNSYLIDSPQPVNISYLWNFGSLLGVCLVIQIITGITLAMHYTPSIDAAFISVEHIMRDVNYGWLIRYLHANTASFFFLFVYAHMARGLYYGSYRSPRVLVWSIGVVIFLVMIITAFLGYVLPYGQMSLWGATVITNLMSAIPWIGQDIVEFIWGGFSVSNATLNRFFSLHYLLPFVLAALIIMHMIALHESGSNNPVGVTGNLDRLAMHPYFIFKDLVTIVAFFLVLSLFVFYAPNVLGHSDNYIPANPMQTPASIVPEWYLLPFYAILRSIPNKLLGVLAMIAAILVLFLMPIVDLSRLRGNAFKPFSKIAFAIFAVNFLLLMWLGSQHVESPYVEIGQMCTAYYFAHFLLIIPTISVIENTLMDVALSDNDNKKSSNAIISSPTGLRTDDALSKGQMQMQILAKRSYSKFQKSKIWICELGQEIIRIITAIKKFFFNPIVGFKNLVVIVKANVKYIFTFKNFYLSIVIAGFAPQIASWFSNKSNENLDSDEIYIFIFWVTISIAYFLFFLAFYHSTRAVMFALRGGSVSQKLLATLSFTNTFSSIFLILNYFIHFDIMAENILEYFTLHAEGGDDDVSSNEPAKTQTSSNEVPARTPSPVVDLFNDSTGRGGFQPAVDYSREIGAAANSAVTAIEAKSTFVQRVVGATGLTKLASQAAFSGEKKTAILYGTAAAVTSAVTGAEFYRDFKKEYDKILDEPSE